MNKFLYTLLLGASFLLGRESTKFCTNRKEKDLEEKLTELKKENTALEEELVDYSKVDFYDPHFLRIGSESMLNKRILPLPSAINMRDIGGYTNKDGKHIKWDKIFRGEELSHLDKEDEEKFRDYNINYVIDFREEDKVKKRPDLKLDNAEYRNISVLKGLPPVKIDFNDAKSVDKFMRHIYKAQVDQRADRFAEVLKILRDDPDAKLYIHCTNGKDRTGFMIALIMLLAGIDEEKIISEYSLTNITFDKAFNVLAGTMADEVNAQDKSTLKGFYGVNPDWLKIQLDYIKDNYDSVDDYLIDKTDLTQEDLDTIRNNILE